MSLPAGEQLGSALGRGTPSSAGTLGRVLRVERSPFAYATSFPIERLEVEYEGGERRVLLLKRLDWDGLPVAIRTAKPRFVHDPAREPFVYAELLAPRELDGGIFWSAWGDPGPTRNRLLLSWVQGPVLFEVGDRQVWEAVARWAARLHATMADDLPSRPELLDIGPELLGAWLDRAQRFAAAGPEPRADLIALERIAACAGAIGDVLERVPATLVHGELFPSNVLIDEAAGRARVIAVDWEMAARGPGLVDLAALTAGTLEPGWGAAIEGAYGEELALLGRSDLAPDIGASLACCRLYVAIRQLGWAPRSWDPPRQHRQDWLQMATDLAEQIG